MLYLIQTAMDLFFAYFVFILSLTIIIFLLGKTKAWEILHLNKDKKARLLFTVPAGLINPLGDHSPHEIQTTAELYKRLGELEIPFTVEAAVHSIGEEIYFYLVVPEKDKRRVSDLVESLWPTGYLGEAEEYDLWLRDEEKKGSLSAGYFSLSRPFAIPLKTARRGHFEPFLSVLNALSSLKTLGESAALQIIVKPASNEMIAAVKRSLESLESGNYQPHHTHESFRITPESLKSIRSKVSSPLFSVNYRVVAVAKHEEADKIFKKVSNAIEENSKDHFMQLNELVIKMPKDQNSLLKRFLSGTFSGNEEILLNADELSTYFHLPGRTTPIPKIKR